MQRVTSLRIVLGMLGLVLVAVAAGYVAAKRFAPVRPVYTMDTVRAGLQRRPQVWIGRSVLVRGTVAGGFELGHTGLQRQRPIYEPLVSAARTEHPHQAGTFGYGRHSAPSVGGTRSMGIATPRTVSFGPIVGALRRLPLVAGLFPTPPRWDTLLGASSVFRLMLLPLHGTRCRGRPDTCADAVREDARP